MIALVIAALIIGIFSSTRAGRDEARKRLARWNPLFYGLTIAIWAVLLYPWK
jgi:hypothetical protein